MLTGLLMNQDHDQIANMDDAAAVAHVFEALGKVYGRGRRWRQKDVLAGKTDRAGKFHPNFLRADWSKDPFALGGNSYLAFAPRRSGRMLAKEAREALKDPQLESRSILHVHDTVPGVGENVTVPMCAFKLAHGGPSIETPPPRLGEHNDEILGGLGYAASDIAALRDEGVI